MYESFEDGRRGTSSSMITSDTVLPLIFPVLLPTLLSSSLYMSDDFLSSFQSCTSFLKSYQERMKQFDNSVHPEK